MLNLIQYYKPILVTCNTLRFLLRKYTLNSRLTATNLKSRFYDQEHYLTAVIKTVSSQTRFSKNKFKLSRPKRSRPRNGPAKVNLNRLVSNSLVFILNIWDETVSSRPKWSRPRNGLAKVNLNRLVSNSLVSILNI